MPGFGARISRTRDALMNDRERNSDDDVSWLERLLPLALERATESEEPVKPPTPDEVDAYLNGGLDPGRRQEIQKALIRSAAHRSAIIKRGKELRRLADKKPNNFAAMVSKWLRGPMVLVPVAAVAVVIAGYLILRNPETPSVASMARVLTIVPGGMTSIELPVFDSSRGDSEPGPVPTQIPPGASVVVKLPVVLFAGDPAPVAVEIRDAAGRAVWSHPLSPPDIANDALILQLDARQFEAGDYSLVVTGENGLILAEGRFRR